MSSSRLVLAMLALAGCVTSEPPITLPLPSTGAGVSGGSAGTAAPTPGDPNVCEPRDPAVTGPMLHAQALDVLGGMGKAPSGVIGACSFSSCHTPPKPRGNLLLNTVMDLSTMKNKPSCEAPGVMLVAPGGGNAALANSWLWIKMVAPIDKNSGGLVGQPAWGAGNQPTCGDLTATTPFGIRMPKGGDPMMLLDETRLGAIRRWICADAPGPN